MYQNVNMAVMLRGLKQKKLCWGNGVNKQFLVI